MKPVKGYRYVKWLPGVSYNAVATQNGSEWPCSMCPIPPGSGFWGWGHPMYIFLIFPGHLEFWTPLQIPSWGPPLGCTLLQIYKHDVLSYSSHIVIRRHEPEGNKTPSSWNWQLYHKWNYLHPNFFSWIKLTKLRIICLCLPEFYHIKLVIMFQS